MPIISGGKVIEGAMQRKYNINAPGAPTTNVTGLGVAQVGDEYTDTTAGKKYIVTATDGATTIAWTVIGTQV